MVKGIHFLLTYQCNAECDHCFLYCGPSSPGTFTAGQVKTVLDEASTLGTIDSIYFEGGEPFLYYPLLLEGLKLARARGFKTGVVTNAYFATAHEDALLWLRPLAEAGMDDFSVSDDLFHQPGRPEISPAQIAARAAVELGLPVCSICIEPPATGAAGRERPGPGEPVTGGGVLFRGRAVEKLAGSVPGRSWREFTFCPHEKLDYPERVHVDPFGHVHICQGISIGNMWEKPLSRILRDYDAATHPVCGPLLRGGPALLADSYSLAREACYADACHFCYSMRLLLLDRFPSSLAPRQVYGV